MCIILKCMYNNTATQNTIPIFGIIAQMYIIQVNSITLKIYKHVKVSVGVDLIKIQVQRWFLT